ncbi:MAG: response regulator transcription factor [Chthoniobacterales bacterium]|nr:response regulator transcription factor [Chthoniobacterales bacterium]
MRAFIIDDSPEDALNLRELLVRMPGWDSVAQAHSIAAARTVLEEGPPDVVFLDIELGRHSGFDLLPCLPADTRVILTTVHTAYGPQAFDANAVDYIVKPVTEERLLRALAKLGPLYQQTSTGVQVYRGGGERIQIALESVAAVVADRDHTIVYCGSRRYPDHRRFSEWMKLTEGHPFTQLDRSTLVRRDLVHSWTPYGSGLTLKFRNSPQELALGRAAAKRFLGSED